MSPLTIWGMLHLPALPGAPNNTKALSEIQDCVNQDAERLVRGGITHLVLENLGDWPYFKDGVPRHTATTMTRIALGLINKYPSIDLGVNVLRNDALSALAIAKAIEPHSRFIRVNVLSFPMITDQGIIEGRAAELLRERKAINADIEIWADINVKHARPLVTHDIVEVANDTIERGGATRIILTGSATGAQVPQESLAAISRHFPSEMIVIGSGVTIENVTKYVGICGNLIVGTGLKVDGRLSNPIDQKRVEELVRKVH